MTQEILTLSWWTIFGFGLKAISAWVCALMIVLIPVATLKAILERRS